MRPETPPWQHGVVLVCTNERGPGATKPSCGKASGELLAGWLKSACRQETGPVGQIRVLRTSCLDVCPHKGTVVAFEPGAQVLTVDPEADRDALLDATKAHFAGVAQGEGGGRARRILGKLRR